MSTGNGSGGRTGPGGGGPPGPRGATGPRPPAPAAAPEQALEVLPGGGQQGLAVHLRQPAQPEAPQPVPLLGLPEERLDPDGALARGLRVGLGGVVGAHAVKILLVEAPVDDAPEPAGGAGGFGRAGVAD